MTLFKTPLETIVQNLVIAAVVFVSLVLIGALLRRLFRTKLAGIPLLALANGLWAFLWLTEKSEPSPAPALLLVEKITASITLLLWAVFVTRAVRQLVWEGYFREHRKTVVPALLRNLAAVIVFGVAIAWIFRE